MSKKVANLPSKSETGRQAGNPTKKKYGEVAKKVAKKVATRDFGRQEAQQPRPMEGWLKRWLNWGGG